MCYPFSCPRTFGLCPSVWLLWIQRRGTSVHTSSHRQVVFIVLDSNVGVGSLGFPLIRNCQTGFSPLIRNCYTLYQAFGLFSFPPTVYENPVPPSHRHWVCSVVFGGCESVLSYSPHLPFPDLCVCVWGGFRGGGVERVSHVLITGHSYAFCGESPSQSFTHFYKLDRSSLND